MTPSLFDLSGKCVVVTGGDSGIGLGMAEGLARCGADLCIVSNDERRHEAARAALSVHGGRVLTLTCDIADEDQVEAAFAGAIAGLGRIDGCFANAGLSGVAGAGPFPAMTSAHWRAMIDTNLTGAFLTLRAASRHMVQRAAAGDPGGRLVATSSLAAISGNAFSQHYAAAKAGLVAVTNGLAVELAGHGVTANAILPGFIDTPMTADLLGDRKPFQRVIETRVPMRRAGTPADFAGIAVYLMSEASRYHTGDTFRIDGGYFLA